MTNIKKKIKIFFYALLALGLIILIHQTDIHEIIHHLRLVDIKYLLLAASCQLITVILMAAQWSSMVGMAGFQPNFIQSFLMNAVGNVADALNPGVKVGGEYFRFDQLRKRFSMTSENSILVVALQKIVSISAFFILTTMSLIYLIFSIDADSALISSLIATIIIFGIITALLAVIFLKPAVLNVMLNKLAIKETGKDKIHRFLKNYHETLDYFKSDTHKIVLQFLLALFIWTFYAVKLYIVCRAFSIDINGFMAAAITYITYMIGMIPLLPGSIGSFEAGMITLFALAGIETSLTVSVAVVFRIVTFWFEFAFCGFVLILERFLKKERKCVS